MQMLYEPNGTGGTVLPARILKNQNHCSLQVLQDGSWGTVGTLAEKVNLTDSGSYYSSADVEGALQEIGAALSGLQTALEAI